MRSRIYLDLDILLLITSPQRNLIALDKIPTDVLYLIINGMTPANKGMTQNFLGDGGGFVMILW